MDSWLDHCPFARPDLVALWSQSQITALKSHVLTMQAAIGGTAHVGTSCWPNLSNELGAYLWQRVRLHSVSGLLHPSAMQQRLATSVRVMKATHIEVGGL